MKDHSGCNRQFVQVSRAWYAKSSLVDDTIDEIVIGFYHPDGGTTGEFVLQWVCINNRPTPILYSFEDSWNALWSFQDLLEKMADLDGENPSPEQICQILLELGVEDATPKISPYTMRGQK